MATGLAWCGEEGPPGAQPPGERRPERVRPGREGGPGDRRPPWARNEPASDGLRLVNVLDAAKLTLAQVHLGKEGVDKATEILNKVVAESKDQAAVGYAHLMLAQVYRRKKMDKECQAELEKVTGPAYAQALAMLLEGVEDRPAKLEELLGKAKDPLVITMLVRRLVREYQRAGNAEKLADLAERAPKLLTFKQAMDALETELRMAQADEGRGGPFGRDRNQMRAEFQQAQEQMTARIKELEAAGKKDEAAELRQRMERMQQMMERFGRGGREGPPERERPGQGGREEGGMGGEVF